MRTIFTIYNDDNDCIIYNRLNLIAFALLNFYYNVITVYFCYDNFETHLNNNNIFILYTILI